MKRLSAGYFLIGIFLLGFPLAAFSQTEEQTPPALEAGETAAPAAAPAPEPKPPVVKDVEVRGNQIVSTSTILSKMKSQKGSTIQQESINADIKRLYATGFFQDIRMEIEEENEGLRLIVIVEEKPIIRTIEITGFTVFKEEKIRKAFKLIEGQILDQKAVKEGEQEIRKLYSDKGYRFVDIKTEIDINDRAKDSVIRVLIVEGERFRIKDVQFEGVEAFKHKQVRKVMKTKKKHLFSRGIFKQDVFQKDLERIRLFYQQEGYLDVKVVPELDYQQKEKKIIINIKVEEGTHYKTGELKIKGNQLFAETELLQVLEMLPGLTYSQYYLFQDVENIRKFYHAKGYMDARVIPDIQLSRDTGKVDVAYQIEEGDLSFVEQVVVRGNTKTKDIVIRRELRIRPGERFDGDKIEKSKQRLDNLGYFEEVTYDTEPVTGAKNRRNIIFRVKEKRTGELSFGGGISSVDRFVGFAEVAQRNFDLYNWPRFTGGGQSLSVRARIGSISQDFNIGFVEPYMFNKPISLGLDAFNIRRDDTNVDFEQERLGVSGTLSRAFKDIFRVGTGYTLERVELNELSEDAPPIVRDSEGTNWLSRVRLFSSMDTRDNVFNPTKGLQLTGSAEWVGSFLGGDQDFYILQTSYTQYWKIFKDHIIEFKTRLGTSDAVGDTNDVPVFDRFYAGGLGTVRGYNYRRVGPIESGDAIGGESLAIVNLEYTIPIPKLDAFKGSFFIDAGSVDPDSYKLSFSDAAVSIGPGIKVRTPIGPVAFYYGFPIANRDTEDENGRFEFSLSRGF